MIPTDLRHDRSASVLGVPQTGDVTRPTRSSSGRPLRALPPLATSHPRDPVADDLVAAVGRCRASSSAVTRVYPIPGHSVTSLREPCTPCPRDECSSISNHPSLLAYRSTVVNTAALRS